MIIQLTGAVNQIITEIRFLRHIEGKLEGREQEVKMLETVVGQEYLG
jgi:hypothetical protein